jgi:toxin-antitoxin system PIN domain toxin
MIAVDTNILVYSQRVEMPWHTAADRCITELAEGSAPWAIPWQCLHEFIAVSTNPRIWKPPTSMEAVLHQVSAWLDSPSVVVLTEGPDHWKTLQAVLTPSGVTGARVHDARIAALCFEHGVSTLWSADRDFSRYSGLKVVNPLVK